MSPAGATGDHPDTKTRNKARSLVYELRKVVILVSVTQWMQIMNSPLLILNLEDNVNDSTLNHEMLSARWPDCRLVRVDNRDDFALALEESKLDLILSDYTMPNFSGLEALAMARTKRPQVPFLFVSGTIGEDAAIEALKNGASDYVLKHRLMRLIPAVDRALRELERIAEIQRAEEYMRESEHKYRELFESLQDAAFLVDDQTEKIIDVNRRALELLGASRSEILGRKQPVFLAMDHGQTGKITASLISTDDVMIPVHVHTSRLSLYDRPLILRLCQVLPLH
jgi:PAS domain-containing protein